MTFQDVVLALQKYWSDQGCLIAQPYDIEKGAATFNPTTFLRSLGPEPFNAAFIEPCRRPTDGRYGENPNRMQHYFQFQVIMKPNPDNFQELYLGSLEALGINVGEHDIRFVHDDWESPTLGAWGLGWEVWLDGMEITQFTYFQQVGGYDLKPVMGEITYGVERICTYLQKVDSVYDIRYNDTYTYGDIYHQNEVQFSKHNFELSDASLHFELFNRFEKECLRLCEAGVPAPAFDYCMKASHSFNLLDARGAISVNERQGYILRVRTLAKTVADAWIHNRQELDHPLLKVTTNSAGETLALPLARTGKIPSDPSQTAPLLVELGVEEMPARVFVPLLKELPTLVQKHLGGTLLDAEDIRIFASPRRITLSIASLRLGQPDRDLVVKGPPARIAKDEKGAWTKAALAFAGKNGIAPDALQIKESEGGEYLFASVHEKGRPAAEILAEALPRVFSEISWYKTMRWGEGEKTPFVRPVRWLVALLGENVIPMEFAGHTASNESRGHRFLHPGPVTVRAGRKEYLDTLRAAHVLVDHEERQSVIADLCGQTAKQAGLTWKEDPHLLNEVTFLVEFPVPVIGHFREDLLAIPEEVLISEMREHQKYFALTRADGKLANAFIAVSNMVCEDYSLVRSGNEKVIHARFADAEFFLKEDKQTPLSARKAGLDKITFLAALGAEGTLGAKVRRMETLVEILGRHVKIDADEIKSAREIASLSKCDLTSLMVGEFPELQGIMGRYYALAEGLNPKVADGLRDHYLPRHAGDSLPQATESALAGLADRFDSLISMFAKGKIPTGSADPFALRRACGSAIALILSRNLSLNLREFLSDAIDTAYRPFLSANEAEGLLDKLLDFFLARAKHLFQEEKRSELPGGYAWDTFDAAAQGMRGWHDLSDLAQRLEALHRFRGQEDFPRVSETFKRVSNILPAEVAGPLETAHLREPSEQALWDALQEAAKRSETLLLNRRYAEALPYIVSLREPVNRLFEEVMVNDPDEAIRKNRQRLLREVRSQVLKLGDFSAFQIG